MKIQAELQSGTTLENLQDRLAIYSKRHAKYSNLVLLKYDMIESPMGDPLVQECRGLILDEAEDWRVISRPFDKFFNYGEGHGKDIDWKAARVQEKIDGSLCTIYWYDGSWQVATSGTPDASGPVGNIGITFSQLFWDTYYAQDCVLPDYQMVDFNFMFELTSPYNRVVVPHATSRLTLIGVRNRFSGQEYKLEPWDKRLSCPAVRSFPLQTIDQVVDTFAAMDPIKQEGYVIVDDRFHRIKVKHPGYVAIHHMKGEQGPTPKRMLEIARSGEGGELLANFPEWKPMFEEAKTKLDELIIHLEAAYLDATNKTAAIQPPLSRSQTQKEFAMHAMKSRLSSALFALRADKVPSIKQFLADMKIESLMQVLGLKDAPSNPADASSPTPVALG